jgi:predicted acetyltransferase
MESYEYGPCADAESASQLARILSWSFAFPQEKLRKFMDQVGLENVRTLSIERKIVAGYILHSMGQWFGGRRVSMAGVGLVGTSPEERRRGLATTLMEHSVREFHGMGFAISTLFPAKQSLYRRSGYERAGARYRVEIDCAHLALSGEKRSRLPMRLFSPEDFEKVLELYNAFAAGESGPIDRTRFLWERRMNPPDQTVRGFLVEGKEGPEGYVFYEESRKDKTMRYTLHVTDMVARSEDAARTLMGFFHDYRSMASTVEWFGHLPDPFLTVLEEARTDVQLFYPWMIRIVDVERALGERGYPEGVEVELHWEVNDPLIPQNHGRFIQRISGGRSQVERGGEGRIATSIRGLASIYSGFLTPEAARLVRLLDGPPEDLRRARLVFGGPPPWMSDMF